MVPSPPGGLVRTDVEWKYWGKRDPLWSVASLEGREVGGANPWTLAEFLELGASDFRDVRRHWEHYGATFGTCVEIGCGAGRMTNQLVRAFTRVVAIDVSPDQIARAREALGGLASKVDFQVVTAPLIPLPDGSADAVFSCHVLQHLPDDAVATYLREAARVLRPGGTLCVHIPVPGAHITSRQSSLSFALRNAYTRLKRVFGIIPVGEYHRYPVRLMLLRLLGLGFVEIELRLFVMSSNGDFHSYFFARKG